MIQKDFLKEIIRQQEINLHAKEEGMIRDSLCTLPDIDNYALLYPVYADAEKALSFTNY